MNEEWPEPVEKIRSPMYVTKNYAKAQLATDRYLEMLIADARSPHYRGWRERVTGWRLFRTSDGTVLRVRSGWRDDLWRLLHHRARAVLSKAIHPWHDDD